MGPTPVGPRASRRPAGGTWRRGGHNGSLARSSTPRATSSASQRIPPRWGAAERSTGQTRNRLGEPPDNRV